MNFATLLPAALPMVPEELIGAPSRAIIREIASRLPSQVADSTFGFEIPLGDDLPAADFLVSLCGKWGPPALRDAAAQALRSDTDPAWLSVAELAEYWANRGKIDNVWLEFDLGGPKPSVPNLFFEPLYAAAEHWELCDILLRAGPILLGRPLAQTLESSLKRCVQALPERARVFQVGAMRARPSGGFRLCLDQIYLDRILVYLEQIGYPGNLDFVRRTCITLQPWTDAYALQIDVAAATGKRIGLECYLDPRLDEAERLSRREGFLSFLGTQGCCTPAKARHVAHFPGTSDLDRNSAEWPERLKNLARWMGRSSSFARRLHHVKLSCGDDHRLEAKAYLAIRHCWQPVNPGKGGGSPERSYGPLRPSEV